MKKNYVMLAFATLMMAACANNDLVDEGLVKEEVPQAIDFDAFANKTSRAEITDATLQNAKFRVWGYKGDKNGNAIDWTKQQTVFGEDGTVVEYSTNTWKPVDTKYWDKMTKYNFYAAAPAVPTGGATYAIQGDMDKENPGFITISNVSSGKSAASNDFLIARGGTVGVDGNYTGTQHEAVGLTFHHTMAKLSFNLVAGISEDITVTSLIMTGWDNGVGKFTQKSEETPNVLETSEWNIASTIDGEAILVGEGAGNTTVELPKAKTTVPLADTYIMVPQNIAVKTLKFTINYEIDGEEYTAHVGTLEDAQIWGTDSHTTYTITVGPAEIAFNVSVCNWDANKPTPGVGI